MVYDGDGCIGGLMVDGELMALNGYVDDPFHGSQWLIMICWW